MISKHKRLVALVALLASLALVVTGCGGGETTDGGDSDGNGGSAESVEVKIGVSSPFTGDVAALGLGIKNGATLAIEKANEDPSFRSSASRSAACSLPTPRTRRRASTAPHR